MLLKSFKRILSSLLNTKKYRTNIARSIYANLDIPKDTQLLDTSCGEGELLNILFENGHSNLYGIDVAEDSLSKASFALQDSGINLSNQSVLDTNFEIGKFEVLISSLTLHHIDEPGTFLKECARLLATNGNLIIVDYFTINPIHRYFINKFGCPEDYYFDHFYTRDELVTFANDHGYELSRSIRLKTTLLGSLELLQFSRRARYAR